MDTAPTRGEVTRIDKLKDWSSAGGTVWQTTSQATFDAYGRPKTATDNRGRTVHHRVHPGHRWPGDQGDHQDAGPERRHRRLDQHHRHPPLLGSTRPSTTDYNGRLADLEYDPMGRLVKGWEVGWAKVDHPTTPSVEHTYSYAPNRDAYPYTKTRKLHAGGGYLTVVRDQGRLPAAPADADRRGGRRPGGHRHPLRRDRPCGHQLPGTRRAGRARGRALVGAGVVRADGQPGRCYDNASRPTDQILFGTDGVTNLVEKWRTTTNYLGDLDQGDPAGGRHGHHHVERHRGPDRRAAPADRRRPGHARTSSRRYAYNRKGQLAKVTDTDGNEWVYTYDVKGRQITAKDPDKGTTQTTYTVYDEVETTTDLNNTVLVNEYDGIGRRKALYTGSVAAANKLAEWKYDKLYTGQTSAWPADRDHPLRVGRLHQRLQVAGPDLQHPLPARPARTTSSPPTRAAAWTGPGATATATRRTTAAPPASPTRQPEV